MVYVGDGKGADALKPFWRRLRARARIEAVAMDMSPAYMSAVTENLPEAKIVFDRFHVIKLFNDKLSDLRRECSARPRRDGKEGAQGHSLAAVEESREPDRRTNEKQRLEEALRLNKPLATAYYLKEDLRQLW